jgi:bacillithiol biosynthesis cysteine-adding enzyme BshC
MSNALRIPIANTDYFSAIIKDYVAEKPGLSEYYNRFPKLESFKDQILEKGANYSLAQRLSLSDALQRQYEKLDTSIEVRNNLKVLREENTFCITTGHQLNIFTGPLYFWYKIINAVKLCEELKANHPEYNFVPVYWMASEDHDLDEIRFFNFKGHRLQWDQQTGPAVGHLDLSNMEVMLESFRELLGDSDKAEYLSDLFTKAYLGHSNLAEAMRFLVNALFSDLGLVIIDGDDKTLKKDFSSVVESDLFDQTAFKSVSKTNATLSKDYNIQVNPREINLFYLGKNRSRIERVEDRFHIVDTNLFFTEAEMRKELKDYPERFSPNVILRPLYQEIVLPNLCYIGGGGEIAYWFELKSMFAQYNTTFPILLLRNSLLISQKKQLEKAKKLGVSLEDLFLKRSSLIDKMVRAYSEHSIDFREQKDFLKEQFASLYTLAKQTDASFVGAVAAQETKQIKGLENLEKRLLKAEKKRLYERLTRLEHLQEELFPQGTLEERKRNFALYYEKYGEDFKASITKHMSPLAMEFLVLEFDY